MEQLCCELIILIFRVNQNCDGPPIPFFSSLYHFTPTVNYNHTEKPASLKSILMKSKGFCFPSTLQNFSYLPLLYRKGDFDEVFIHLSCSGSPFEVFEICKQFTNVFEYHSSNTNESGSSVNIHHLQIHFRTVT